MDLFGHDPAHNLLAQDGQVFYHGPVLSVREADRFRDALLTGVPWKNDEAVIFGRHLVTARKIAWYGDAGYSYTYSGTTKHALAWNAELLELKELVERLSGTRFNSCLLNLYHHGGEGMSWHSDDESSLGRDSTIASLSLGAERVFRLKHKRLPLTAAVTLEHGSLLLMRGTTQTHWLHCVPKTKKITTPRINLTFRTMIGR